MKAMAGLLLLLLKSLAVITIMILFLALLNTLLHGLYR